MIDLKYNAGILKVDDLKQVSTWMMEDFKLKLSSAALQSRTYRIQLSGVKPPHKAQKLLQLMAVKKPCMTAKVSALPQPRSTKLLFRPLQRKQNPFVRLFPFKWCFFIVELLYGPIEYSQPSWNLKS
jgi:hypothetical protein